MVVDERVRPLASVTRPGHGWHRARFGLRAPRLPLPPVLAPAGSSPASGIWLGLKGSDKIKARGCPPGALNPDNSWHPNTSAWQGWPWWVTISGSGRPRACNPGGEGRKFSGPMGRVEEEHGARRSPVWWDSRDGPSLVGSTMGLSPWAWSAGWDGGARRAPCQGPAVRQEVPESRGGRERDGGPPGDGPASGTARTHPGRSGPVGSATVGLGPRVWGPG